MARRATQKFLKTSRIGSHYSQSTRIVNQTHPIKFQVSHNPQILNDAEISITSLFNLPV